MNFGAYGMNHADRVIAKRRQEEDRIANLQRNVANVYRLGAVASWEESGIKMQQMREKQQAILSNDPIEIAKHKRYENLDERRSKLQKLLKEEEDQYKREVDAIIETPLQRRQRLEQRAKMLKEKRLKQRQEFCQQARLKQFREKCDELRSNHGKNLLMECDRVRKLQMHEKAMEKQMANKDHSKYLTQWRQEYQEKLDRDNRDAERQKQLNQQTAIELANQIKEKEKRDIAERQAQQKLVQQRVQELEQAKQEMARIQQEKLEKLHLKQRQCRQDYEQFQQRRANEAQQEKIEDKEFINSVLEKEKHQAEKEAMKQQGLREDIHGYVDYLHDLKLQEAEKEKMLNQLREKELEKAWQKRELQWKKEELARQQLLQQVYLEREDQIAYKNKLQEKSMNEDEMGSKEKFEKYEKERMEEERKEKERLKYNKEIQDYLKKQMNDRELKREKEKNYSSNIDQNMKNEQKEYERLIRMEAEKDEEKLRQGKSTHHYPKQSANWWTF